MPTKEKGYQPNEAVTRKKEGDRKRYWQAKFVASLAPYYTEYGLTQTQEPTISKLISTVVSNTTNPGEVINPIITDKDINDPEYGGDLWVSLDCLMRRTENLTQKRHRYTAYDFVESLRGFSNTEVANYLQVDAERKAVQGHQRELALSPAKKDRLKGYIDQMLEDPDFIEAHTRYWGRPEYFVYPYRHTRYEWEERQEEHIQEQREFLTSPYFTEQDRSRVNGTMRSFDTCMFQSEYLLDHLPKTDLDLGFLYAEGMIMPYMGVQSHEVIVAVPDLETKGAVLGIQKNVRGFPILTTAGDKISEVSSMSSITVIDASILQLFAPIPFLDDLPHAERIPFAQSIAPGSFSDSGVFIDSYARYIQFLGLMSSFNPDFYVSAQSFRRRRRISDRQEERT